MRGSFIVGGTWWVEVRLLKVELKGHQSPPIPHAQNYVQRAKIGGRVFEF